MEDEKRQANIYGQGLAAASGLFLHRGLGSSPNPAKSARRWSVFGIACGLIWVWGATSVIAVMAGGFAWSEYRRAGQRPTLAIVSLTLGLIGLALSAVLYL